MSQAFHQFQFRYDHISQRLEKLMKEAAKLMKEAALVKCHSLSYVDFIQSFTKEVHEVSSLAACLCGQDSLDTQAVQLEEKCCKARAILSRLMQFLGNFLLEMDDAKLQDFFRSYPELSFPLKELRDLSRKKMPLEKEILIDDLAVSGHESFTILYYTLIGKMKFIIRDVPLGIGEVENALTHHQREGRKEAFFHMKKAFCEKEDLFSQMLNNVIDFRLTCYRHRGWDDVLLESYTKNRVDPETLSVMWSVVEENKLHLVRYMDVVSELFFEGQKLAWYDLEAPLYATPCSSSLSWELACSQVAEKFSAISLKMGCFAENALEKKWVDAEPSLCKRAGGFCASFPLLGESRILMTYSGTPQNQMTLAHELGHAYHFHLLRDKSAFLQDYPMSIAETASTMCEMIIMDGFVKEAQTCEEKLIFLNEKISRWRAFAMDIHARYLFDFWFYQKRREGFLLPNEINDLMVRAQKVGYRETLSEYFPQFWAYKMHFYFADMPFYNWPYTMGFLLSSGVYQILSQRKNFEVDYEKFLSDSSCFSIENLMGKHCEVDIQKKSFWQKCIDPFNQDIQEFLSIVKKEK